MSRIETTLEKAAKLREDSSESPVPGLSKETPPAPSIPAEAFRSEVAIKVGNPYLVAITDPTSPVNEEYKKLKSMVLKVTNSGRSLNTIMVTSSSAAEGKTLTAVNLALTLAQEYDHTVLLVDVDLRRPSISEYLGIPREPGLTDCLTRGVPLSECLVKTGIGKLVVLPAGSRIDNAAELLSSGTMQAFIKEIKHRYSDRYVIFDTPPILTFAEAHTLAAQVDGVLFVVKEGGSTQQNVKEALAQLRDANILGIVFNNVQISRFDSNYRYRYHYGRYGYKTK